MTAPDAAQPNDTPHSDDLRRAPSALAALLPHNLLFGPIFQRDVRATGRRRSTYITRGGYTFILLAIAAVALPGVWFDLRNASGAAQLQSLQGLAPGIASAVLWIQFLVIAMAAPAATAPCICDERNKRTLPALLTTPLRPGHIVFGHLASRTVNILILAAISAPFLLALRVFGGVRADMVLAAVAITLTTALVGAALGLLASIDARRASVASTQAHLLLILAAFAPFLAVVIYHSVDLTPNAPAWAWNIGVATNPVLVLVAVTMEMVDGGRGAGLGMPLSLNTHELLAINLAYQSALALAIAALATTRLRARLATVAVGRTPKRWLKADQARQQRRLKKQQKKTAKRGAAPTPDHAEADSTSAPTRPSTRPSTQDGDHIEFADSRTVSDRPVLWRELRQPLFRSGLFKVLSYLIIPGVLVWWGFFADADRHARVMVPAILAQIGFLFIGCTAAAHAFTGEREGRTWDELLTTRLTAREIVLPKVLGALRRQWYALAFAVLYVGLVGVLRSDLHPAGALFYTASIAAHLTFLAALGAAASLVFKRPATANAVAIGVPVALWIALPTLLAIFGGIFNWRLGPLDKPAFLAHPLFIPTSGLVGALESPHLNTPYTFGNDDVSAVAYAGAVLAHCTLYFGLAALITLATLKSFNRFAPRVS